MFPPVYYVVGMMVTSFFPLTISIALYLKVF
nr:MAG TPA: hypothetical protein [Caudoviricetes sp.]DAY28357.1 MAG TPA: hypothetical protein [Caudoviricetes sp.]